MTTIAVLTNGMKVEVHPNYAKEVEAAFRKEEMRVVRIGRVWENINLKHVSWIYRDDNKK